MPIEVYYAIDTESIMDLLVVETNSYTQKQDTKFRQTNNLEMRKFLALVNYMGNVHLHIISLYWSLNPLYNIPLPRSVRPRDRFLTLLRYFHACENDSPEHSPLSKIQPHLNEWNTSFKNLYEPRKCLVINESMVPWRCRLAFRQYTPGKRHKYRIKLFKLCTPEGYTSNVVVYRGKQSCPQIPTTYNIGVTGHYVLSLAIPI